MSNYLDRIKALDTLAAQHPDLTLDGAAFHVLNHLLAADAVPEDAWRKAVQFARENEAVSS